MVFSVYLGEYRTKQDLSNGSRWGQVLTKPSHCTCVIQSSPSAARRAEAIFRFDRVGLFYDVSIGVSSRAMTCHVESVSYKKLTLFCFDL